MRRGRLHAPLLCCGLCVSVVVAWPKCASAGARPQSRAEQCARAATAQWPVGWTLLGWPLFPCHWSVSVDTPAIVSCLPDCLVVVVGCARRFVCCCVLRLLASSRTGARSAKWCQTAVAATMDRQATFRPKERRKERKGDRGIDNIIDNRSITCLQRSRSTSDDIGTWPLFALQYSNRIQLTF